jgi:hypothetical protein
VAKKIWCHQSGCVSPLRALARWAGPRRIFCPGLNANTPGRIVCIGLLEMPKGISNGPFPKGQVCPRGHKKCKKASPAQPVGDALKPNHHWVSGVAGHSHQSVPLLCSALHARGEGPGHAHPVLTGVVVSQTARPSGGSQSGHLPEAASELHFGGMLLVLDLGTRPRPTARMHATGPWTAGAAARPRQAGSPLTAWSGPARKYSC